MIYSPPKAALGHEHFPYYLPSILYSRPAVYRGARHSWGHESALKSNVRLNDSILIGGSVVPTSDVRASVKGMQINTETMQAKIPIAGQMFISGTIPISGQMLFKNERAVDGDCSFEGNMIFRNGRPVAIREIQGEMLTAGVSGTIAGTFWNRLPDLFAILAMQTLATATIIPFVGQVGKKLFGN